MSRSDTSESVNTGNVRASTPKWRITLQAWRDSGQLASLSPVGVLVLMIAVMSVGNIRFLSLGNFINILEQIATLLIMGLGETFVILLGSIDLSVAAVASLSSIVAAMLLPQLGYGAFFVAVLVGMAAGTITGLVHSKARIPSFVASLGALGVWTGVGFAISQATPIQILRKDGGYLTWATGTILGIPNEIIVAFSVLLLAFILERYTRFGRSVKAIGAGEKAARLSGVPIDRYKTLAFTLSGALAGFCGVILATRMSGGSARIADGFLLKAIAIVILGGTSISGGVGGVFRTLIGVLIIAVLDTGMNVVGVNVFAQQVVYGIVLILAVILTIDRSKMPIVK
jgi:ribose transport system permease protein